MDPVKRFEMAHEKMVEKGWTIPHHVLRAYLDALLAGKRKRNGLHNVTVTVNAGSANIALLDTHRILDSDIVIRVSGQKWQ